MLFDNGILLRESNEHDSSALTMTNVIDFLVGSLINIFKSSRQIECGHFIKREVPESRVFWFERYMLSTIIITSHVSTPYIKSTISKEKGRSHILIRTTIDYPCIS
jgi:hypothetical protein